MASPYPKPPKRAIGATRREGAEDSDAAWLDVALVARDLAGVRALGTMPLAARIAAATVETFKRP